MNSISNELSRNVNHPNYHGFEILGAALTLGGAAASYTIGVARLAPMTAMTVGLAILTQKLLSQSSSTHSSENLAGRVQKSLNTKKMWLTALGIAALTIPIYLGTKFAGCTPTDVLSLQLVNSQRIMATDIPNRQAIDLLQEINGNTIETIETRAREWFNVGFLGHQESFKEVLKQDWETVETLGTTHIELSNHLSAIWDASSECEDGNSLYKNPILYNPQILKNSTIGKGSQTQLLFSCIESKKGFRADIFTSDNASPSDLRIKNSINGETLRVRHTVIDYIKKYGFYEGSAAANGPEGSKNPYRVDPARLVAILTGQSTCAIKESIGQPCT